MRMMLVAAALMAGVGASVAGAQEAAFEARTPNTVHLREGQARPAATLDAVYFDGLTFRREAPDRMTIYLALRSGGVLREEVFRMTRQ
ncbi:MAG: hypothetical protein Q8L86_13290 [Vicinamibacterales bacterium]|nr:hypothetical protein [Vicinamibacterales bacterium]